MFTPFVTDEHPVVLYAGMPPQYTSDGLAIDCALVLHVLKGTARIRCNFEVIAEQVDSVVLFNPGDIIKVEQRSQDFEVEILAFSSFIQLALHHHPLSDRHRATVLRTLAKGYHRHLHRDADSARPAPVRHYAVGTGKDGCLSECAGTSHRLSAWNGFD